MYRIAEYSVAVFIIVLISGCILNLLKQHYIFQLGGIAFFLTFMFFKSIYIIRKTYDIRPAEFYASMLPLLGGLSACVVSMLLGFWIFPYIRKKFKN